jgi:hypothetical protein
VEFAFSLLKFLCELLALFGFVEIGGDVVRCAFAYEGWRMLVIGLYLRELDRRELPRAFNSLQVCSQALASRDEM